MVGQRVQSLSHTSALVHAWIVESWSPKQDWPEYAQALQESLHPANVGPSPPLPLLLLPGLCCQAAGGDPDRTIGVAAAWVLLYTAAHLLDDVEDGERNNESAQTVNVATGLIVTAFRALIKSRRSHIPDQMLLNILDDFAHSVLSMCGSQHTDLSEAMPSLEQGWKMAEAKSGVWFALPCRIGAQIAGASAELVEHYSQFGRHLGLLMQIGDDVQDMRPKTGKSDLAAGKWTLPALYALTVAPDETRERLLRWIRAIARDPSAEGRALSLIEQTGTSLYLAVESQLHYREAEAALRAAAPSPFARDQLLDLLRSVTLSHTSREESSYDG